MGNVTCDTVKRNVDVKIRMPSYLIKNFKDVLFPMSKKHKGKWLGHKEDDYVLDGCEESQIMLYVICFANYNYSTCWEMS